MDKEQRERLWQLPHIQAWVSALKSGYGWEVAIFKLLEKWRQRDWQITLAGRVYVGKFLSVSSSDSEISYTDFLGHDEGLPGFTIQVEMEEAQMVAQLSIDKANITTQNEDGWMVQLYIYKQTLEITAHMASFLPVAKRKGAR